MGKSSPRNPLWPDWFDGEKIDEVTFCHELIRNHPMKCIENRFFTPDGPVEDEAELKQLILKEIQAFIIHGLSKRVANLLESLRILKRGDSYSVRYKYKDHSGKPCEGWESFKTKKEAQERKITVEKELLDGTFLVPDTMTVEEMLYKWIPI